MKALFHRYRKPLLFGFCAVLAAGFGHVTGTRSGDAMRAEIRERETRLRSGSAEGRPDRKDSRNTRTTDSRTSARAKLDRLYDRWRNSPSPGDDYELHSALAGILASTHSDEIAGWLAGIPKELEMEADIFTMRSMVLALWMLQDGPAAMEFACRRPDRRDALMTTTAFREWSETDPQAAFDWLKRDDLPPEQKRYASNLFLNAMIPQFKRDPEGAFARLEGIDPKESARIMEIWANGNGEDQEARQRLMERAAGLEEPLRLRVETGVLSAWARKDPEGAASYVANLDMRPQEKAVLDAAIILSSAKKDPPGTLGGWIERNPEATGIPEPIRQAIGVWVMGGGGEESVRWLETLPQGNLRDVLYKDSISTFGGFDRYADAARLATAIESPELRASAIQTLSRRWTSANPKDAAAWKETLSETDRSVLGSE